MSLKALTAARIFDGETFHTGKALVWENDRIKGLVPTETLSPETERIDYPDATITPGFIDLQVNGGGGVMFNQQTDVEGIDTICRAHRKHGTAWLLPTLISDTPEQLNRALNAAEAALRDKIPGILGVHLEGPWLNPERKGAHNPELFYDPSPEELETMPWLTQGKTLVTLAPEAVSSAALEWLSNNGVIVSCGHSNAEAAELTDTLERVNGFTHLFNAMSPLQGREPGVVGTALMTDHAWCSIITDGIHVAPQSVLLAHRAKPKGKLIIVTDAMATVGSGSDSFVLNGETISVKDNRLVNAAGSLAGAHIGMDQSVAKAIEWGIDEAEALKMASTYPAQALGEPELGQLKTGFRASATILDPDLNSLGVLVDGAIFSG